jgi:hypothetical protein
MQNFKAHGRTKDPSPSAHAMPAALAIRLIRCASFQEKLRQLIVKMRKQKAPASGRFHMFRIGRVCGKF